MHFLDSDNRNFTSFQNQWRKGLKALWSHLFVLGVEGENSTPSTPAARQGSEKSRHCCRHCEHILPLLLLGSEHWGHPPPQLHCLLEVHFTFATAPAHSSDLMARCQLQIVSHSGDCNTHGYVSKRAKAKFLIFQCVK